MHYSKRAWLGLLLVSLGAVPGYLRAQERKPPEFSILTRLQYPKNEKGVGFQSVSLALPYVYVYDSAGTLYIYQLPRRAQQRRLEPSAVRQIGNGDDLTVYKGTLFVTELNGVASYSLTDPAKPQLIARARFRGTSTKARFLCEEKTVYVFGDLFVAVLDCSDAKNPREAARVETKLNAQTACKIGKFLYVGGSTKDSDARIEVYEVTHKNELSRAGFVPLTFPVHGLYKLSDTNLLVSLGPGRAQFNRNSRNVCVDGNVAIVNVASPRTGKVIKYVANSGGLTSALLREKTEAYFVCDGRIDHIDGNDLKPVFTFLPQVMDLNDLKGMLIGSTLRGHYRGDAIWPYAALPFDDEVIMFRVNGQARKGSDE